MAEVDFSNARLEPKGTKNPTTIFRLGLDNSSNSGRLYTSNGTEIASGSCTLLINQQKKLMFLYQGTFTASGTECYIYWNSGDELWKMSNISFNSGDTYVFQIRADMINQ